MTPNIQQLGYAARQAMAAKNWPAVKQCANQILSIDKDNSDGWFLAGMCAKAGNQLPAAIHAFTQSLASDGKRCDSAVELATLHWQVARHSESVELLQRYTPLLSNSPKYMFMAAETYSRLGLHAQAWPLYKSANEAQPNVPSIEAGLAASSTKVGEVALAAQLYGK